jgi:cell wall-associated NlpC family hydrolase
MERASCAWAVTPLRDEPDDASEQHTQVLEGENVDVLAQGEEWSEVVIPDGYRGFLRTAALGPARGDPAHVVVEPEVDGRYLGSWLDAATGGTEPLETARAGASGQRIVETARRFLGTEYLWGGMTVRGIDCSGLVQAVHRRFGLLLPRNADQQEAALPEVPRAEASAGDLVCFEGHIAIVSSGDVIVHASGSAGRVVEEQIPEDLSARILSVRRVYGSTSDG